MNRREPACPLKDKYHSCGSDNCRVSDNKEVQHWETNGFFTLGNVDGKPAQGFRNDVKAPKRTKHLKEQGTAVSTFELQAHPGALNPRRFVNNSITSGFTAPRKRGNGIGGELIVVQVPLFRTAVYKGNGPVAIDVESNLRFQDSRSGSDKSCRTIMTKDFDRWERNLRFDPQLVHHIVDEAGGLPVRGGSITRQFDTFSKHPKK